MGGAGLFEALGVWPLVGGVGLEDPGVWPLVEGVWLLVGGVGFVGGEASWLVEGAGPEAIGVWLPVRVVAGGPGVRSIV